MQVNKLIISSFRRQHTSECLSLTGPWPLPHCCPLSRHSFVLMQPLKGKPHSHLGFSSKLLTPILPNFNLFLQAVTMAQLLPSQWQASEVYWFQILKCKTEDGPAVKSLIFPAPMSGSPHSPRMLALGDLTATSGLCRYQHSRVHTQFKN